MSLLETHFIHDYKQHIHIRIVLDHEFLGFFLQREYGVKTIVAVTSYIRGR